MNQVAAISPERKKWLMVVLTIILMLRICSYFTVFPGSIGITRVIKIGTRFLMTGASLGLLLMLISQARSIKFQYINVSSGLLYLAYAILGFASILWSTNILFTVLQLMMLFESIAFVLFFYHLQVIYNLRSDGHADFSQLMAVSITIISIGFLIGLYVDPSTFFRDTHGGAVSRLGGFIINPNELGMLASIGAAMNYLEMSRSKSKFWNILSLIINIAVLLLTQSRSSLGGFLLVSLVFIYKSGNRKLQFATLVGGIFVLPVLVNTIIIKEGDVSEVMSMTGRLPFWSDLITFGFPDRPILGYGFMSISPSPFTDKFDSIHAYAASMTHNTFVQVLINLGLVGAFIVLFQMIATGFAFFKSKDEYLELLCIALFIPIFINSLTEFGIFGEANYGIMFYQLIILFMIIEAKHQPKLKYKNNSLEQFRSPSGPIFFQKHDYDPK